MRRDIARAIFLLRDGAEWLAKPQMSIVEGERHDIPGFAGKTLQPVIKAQGFEHLDPIRADLEAGADFAEAVRALIDSSLAAELAQTGGRRKSANSASDNCDPQFARHHISSGFFSGAVT